jgi:hypothetical protein
VFAPAAIHRTDHRQKYEEDEEEHKDNRTQWPAFIAVTGLLRGAGDLGRLVGGEFELGDNAINARIDATTGSKPYPTSIRILRSLGAMIRIAPLSFSVSPLPS